MDAYEALKETFDDLFQQAVEEGCYTEDEAAELVESLDIYNLLQVVRHNNPPKDNQVMELARYLQEVHFPLLEQPERRSDELFPAIWE